jgi:glycogen debranching enzyme
MKDIIQYENQYYILATSSLADGRTQVLKHDDIFSVFDRYGDITPFGTGEQGLYFEGTRYLSCLQFLINSGRPLLLSSTLKQDNTFLTVDLANPDYSIDGHVVLPKDTLHIARTVFLWNGTCYQQIIAKNYDRKPIDVSFVAEFEADFVDIFEVRGIKRTKRGNLQKPVLQDSQVVLSYEGLDNQIRETKLDFFPKPSQLDASKAVFNLTIPAQGEETIFITINCQIAQPHQKQVPVVPYYKALVSINDTLNKETCGVYTSNEQFNDWINRSFADLEMMLTETPTGKYPYAGVPWFSTAFGRDGIITALESLWIAPDIAKGVLAYLSKNQAQEVIPELDAEPGKIMHETRKGEMANLKEVPFGLYYGSIDATPLFVMLANAYYERTGDLAFIKEIWPNIHKALDWIDLYGDSDKDGFVEYTKRSKDGLIQQGWKDSHDSVFHADGKVISGQIALCEVQSYVYSAKKGAARLASILGYAEHSQKLLDEAYELQKRFEAAFWCEELSTYALALDENKQPCKVKSSNAGHALFAGIATHEHARRTVESLLKDDSFSGWGIRTLASSEVPYNPMSYHNGSIWPHDNAMIAAGFARYGFKEQALAVMRGMFETSIFMDLHRLPELFCGFNKRPGEGPTLYPVACAPQAWSTAAVFYLLQACLGISFRYEEKPQICFSYPMLPEFLQEIRITNLRMGKASADILLKRNSHDDVAVNILRRHGDLEIVSIK